MKQVNIKNIKWKSIIRMFMLIICGAILGINIYMANAAGIVGNKLPMPFRYGAAVVLSGSMEPELSKGDLIIVKKNNNYEINDIAVYQDENILVVHRIIEIEGETVTTKGDANKVADDSIHMSAIKGKMLFSIPLAGSIVNIIKTPIGSICIIAVAIALVEIPGRKEKKKDEEEQQKIIDEINRLKDE